MFVFIMLILRNVSLFVLRILIPSYIIRKMLSINNVNKYFRHNSS